jgi:PST family polysaccharide transporter
VRVKLDIKNVLMMYGEKYFAVFSSLAASMFLARILTPEEIGLQSIAVSFVMFLQYFRDFGISSYLHNASDLDQTKYSECLGVAWLLGSLLFIFLILTSFFSAELFGDSRIGLILLLLSANFIFYPIQTTIFAVFMRRSKIQKMFYYSMLISAFAGISSVLLALLGFSYYSSAISSVFTGLIGLALCYLIREKDFKNIPSFSNLRAAFGFGFWPFLGNLFRFIGERAPEFMIARNSGFSNSAFYEKGHTGSDFARRMTLDPFYPIFVGALNGTDSRLMGKREASSLYLSLGVLIGVPCALFVFLNAEEFINILFGYNWVNAIPVLQALAWMVPLVFLSSAVTQIAYGNTDFKRVNVISVFSRIVLCGLIFWFRAAETLVLARIVVVSEIVIVFLLFISIIKYVDIKGLFSFVLRAVPVAIGFGFAVYFSRLIVDAWSVGAFWELMFVAIFGLFIWVVFCLFVRHPLLCLLFPRLFPETNYIFNAER